MTNNRVNHRADLWLQGHDLWPKHYLLFFLLVVAQFCSWICMRNYLYKGAKLASGNGTTNTLTLYKNAQAYLISLKTLVSWHNLLLFFKDIRFVQPGHGSVHSLTFSSLVSTVIVGFILIISCCNISHLCWNKDILNYTTVSFYIALQEDVPFREKVGEANQVLWRFSLWRDALVSYILLV